MVGRCQPRWTDRWSWHVQCSCLVQVDVGTFLQRLERQVDISKITDAASLQNVQSRVAEALAKGSVDTEGAATLMTTLNSIAKTMEMVDLEKRLIALEEYVKSGKAVA